MPDFFRVTDESGVQVVDLRLPVALDINEFDKLNTALLEAVAPRADGRWVVDLAHVSYMGSAMLGLLVNVRQRVKAARGKLVLCGLSPQLSTIFRACCMDRLFTTVRDRERAVAAALG